MRARPALPEEGEDEVGGALEEAVSKYNEVTSAGTPHPLRRRVLMARALW